MDVGEANIFEGVKAITPNISVYLLNFSVDYITYLSAQGVQSRNLFYVFLLNFFLKTLVETLRFCNNNTHKAMMHLTKVKDFIAAFCLRNLISLEFWFVFVSEVSTPSLAIENDGTGEVGDDFPNYYLEFS